MSQNEIILSHLKRSSITPLQALDVYGVMRLAARIADLRSAGNLIATETVKRGTKKYARYHLVKQSRRKQ